MRSLVEADTGLELRAVISNRPDAPGLEIAASSGIPTETLDHKSFPHRRVFDAALDERLKAAKADLVCLAGWLCLLDVPGRYLGRIMNIHPALLPTFGGKGMFGVDKYYLAIFGKPSATQPWMMQFGGHHLGVNVTVIGKHFVLTPTHTGAQPALFERDGKDVRPLGLENDTAFKFRPPDIGSSRGERFLALDGQADT